MTDAFLPTSRPLPELTGLNRAFWTSGGTGHLQLQHCRRCERLIHPPALLCPDDHSAELDQSAVSGRARVESWTENLHGFLPSFPPSYFIAYVTPVEDPRVRILTNLVNVERADLVVGMPVRVVFERHDADGEAIFVPLFEPDPDA